MVITGMLLLTVCAIAQEETGDYELWEKEPGGMGNAVTRSYPKLNHLPVEGDGKSNPPEYQAEGHVAAYVVEDIANFIFSQAIDTGK